MKKYLFLIVLAVMLLPVLSAQSRPRLAILPFTGGVGTDGETIAMLLGNQAELRNAFTTVPRTSNIDAIMGEQRFQRSGLTDSDTIAQLGRQMNADYVVAGHIQQLGARRLVLITIVHVESLQQIAGAYKEYTVISEIRDELPDMVRTIVAASRQDTSRLPRLAVAPFNIMLSGVTQAQAEVLTHILAIEIANSGRFAVLPRTSTIERVMQEHSIQRSGITDPANIRRIGQATNATYVLAGSIASLGPMNLFIAQRLNVQSGEQVDGGDEEYRVIEDGISKMRDLSRKLTGAAGPARGNIPANFVRVEGGTFQMGSSSGGNNDERPVRNVTVSSFHMSIHPVTQREWFEVMGTNPSHFRGDNLPVENVSWFEAIEYCNRRSLREGLTPVYRGSGNNITVDWTANGYRLPTEAEWEFAAKGGNNAFLITEYSGSNNVDAVAWFSGNSGNRTQPVGTKAPNSLGLYDMSGNVWEWCWDWYGTYPSSAQTDPRGPASGSARVLRGGSWISTAANVRSACRLNNTPTTRGSNIGFRVVRP
jgi:formylglycine-generating enzyme required for sulfatase activity/TolB-like protein